ncbi:CoA pyrophosphatase [Arthrobacter sp. I2-34]|uniref:CoA pyrophosphatase n=1 Tax=Arthrobacter hankyongi TaxID=2904801 RepID=A0ABS9LA36_9MICC|nr:CoA pyrophosphatase [Arthrobacter hankyongi]MCG2623535.1 CoA pyrophosphatase [Arthrobacter hankyongi]
MSAKADLERLVSGPLGERLSVRERERWRLDDLDPQAFRRAAVLLLFGPLDAIPALSHSAAVPDDLDVLLIERAGTLSDHPGQVAFPGGGIDPGDDGPEAAALREAVEETGLDAAGVDILGTLQDVPLGVSQFLVTPVLAWWTLPSPVAVVDFNESAQVFRVPVADLLQPDNRYTTVLRRAGRIFRGPAFAVNGVVVWGFTAAILSSVFDEAGWTQEWDRTREIPAPVRPEDARR